MKTAHHFKVAADRVLEPGTNIGDILAVDNPEAYIQSYLQELESEFAGAEAPDGRSAADHLSYAIFNQSIPIEQRRDHANQAFDIAKTKVITSYGARVPDFDAQRVLQESDGYSTQFVEKMIALTDEQTSANGGGMESFRRNVSFMYPEEKTVETQAVTAVTLLGVLQPYLVERLLALDVYKPETLKQQILEIRNDCQLIANFSKSISAFLEFTATGKRSHSDAEIADQLFGVGPLFAQIGQSFSANAEKVDESPETSQLVGSIARAFQEGIAMPDSEQQAILAQELPEGLSLEEVFSSAKIAYVAKTKLGDEEYATKIKRPGVEDALAGNVRTFVLLTEVMQRYIETHSANSTLAKSYGLMKDSMPFVLGMLQRDMMEEMDLAREARMQKHGAGVLSRHGGIIVPEILDSHSDSSHITMEYIPSERIEALPANPKFIENAMILVLEGRRSKFLHGDMHAGNVKALGDDPLGRLVAYDWGKSIELPPEFEKNVVSLVLGAMTQNPKKIARAFEKVQDSHDQKIATGQVEEAAREAITEVVENISERKKLRQSKMSAMERRMQQTTDIITSFSIVMAKRYQTGLDVRYVNYMKSMTSLATIMQSELAKPEYANRRYKATALLRSAASAVRAVYGKRTKRSH